MKYVIVTIEWLIGKGIVIPESARKNNDGTEVILHYGYIIPVLTEQDDIKIYEYDSSELRELLNSEMWSSKEEIINE